jgi:hypothetical protein
MLSVVIPSVVEGVVKASSCELCKKFLTNYFFVYITHI